MLVLSLFLPLRALILCSSLSFFLKKKKKKKREKKKHEAFSPACPPQPPQDSHTTPPPPSPLPVASDSPFLPPRPTDTLPPQSPAPDPPLSRLATVVAAPGLHPLSLPPAGGAVGEGGGALDRISCPISIEAGAGHAGTNAIYDIG